jgi:hypothetical protein
MKLSPFLLFSLFQFISCSSQLKTSDTEVKKTITITEFLVLNQNFNSLDTLHQQKTIKKFDTNNNLLEEMDYWGSSSTFGGGILYKYDQSNRKIEEQLLGIDKIVITKYQYEYSDNKAIQYEIYADNSKFKRKTNYFDSKNNLIRETALDNIGIVMYDYYYKYDTNNLEIESSGLLNSKKSQTNYKIYDSLSNLIEQKSIDSNGIVLSVEKFIYEKFDKDRNWGIRKSILRGSAHSIAFQKIENN